MSAALDAILQDFNSNLEWLVELSCAKRADGTLKTWTVSSVGRDLGAGETAYPLLLPDSGATIGPLSQSLSEDLLFGGLAEASAGTIRLVQSNPDIVSDTSILSSMMDYTYAGYRCRIRVCLQSLAQGTTLTTTNAPTFRTLTFDQEPTFSFVDAGPSLSFPLASILQRMAAEPLIVKRYVGIPHCMRFKTSASSMTRAHDAKHSLSRFTAMVRFRTSSSSAGVMALFRKQSSLTNCNWSIRMLQTSGFINGVSTTGAAQDVFITSTTNYADGLWHMAVLSRDNARTAYLMVDGEVIGTVTPTGTTDLPASTIEVGTYAGTDRYIQDVRLYDRYMSPDEARAVSAVRCDGDDLGIVGLWRFDDNTGGSVNDYSVNNLDGTIVGTVTTDYVWAASDLGEPEQAGRPFITTRGLPFNALAHFIDTNREGYRLHSNVLVATPTIKSRGTVLSISDYTDTGTGIYRMVSAEDSPVTFDLTSGGTDDLFYISNVARDWLLSNTRIAPSTEEDSTQTQALVTLCPWSVGQVVEEDATYGSVLSALFAPVAMHYREQEDGSFFADLLRSPLGLSIDGLSMLDLRGKSTNTVEFGNIGSASSSLTILCWFRSYVLDQTAYSLGISDFYFVTKGSSPNYALSLRLSGSDAGKLVFYAGSTLKTDAGLINYGDLYCIAAVFDNTADTMKIYLARRSNFTPDGEEFIAGTFAEVASASSITTTPTTNSDYLRIGGLGYPWGAVAGLQVWTVAKSQAQLDALMATPPVGNESNLAIYCPLTGESLLEVVTSTTGTITGTPAWSPKLSINLDETPEIIMEEYKLLRPAWKIVVRYRRNWHPMTAADVDTGVTENRRIDLGREWLEEILINEDVRSTYTNARELVLDTLLVEREDAMRLAKFIAFRFGVYRVVARLSIPAHLEVARVALGLQIGDDIKLTSSSPAVLADGLLMRAVGGSPDPLNGSVSLVALS